MEYAEQPEQGLGALPSGSIYRSTLTETAIMSRNTEFHNEDTEFYTEVPLATCTPEENLPEGTINITDSALMATVIGSEDTTIDNRGAKISAKIPAGNGSPPTGVYQPESDIGPSANYGQRSETGITTNNSVLLNAVVGSSDTKINMSGAKIKIKKKRSSNRHRPNPLPVPGHINLDNSVAVSMVAASKGTNVILKDADITVE